ncbi:MAG TPA: hypothetical protein P5567_15175 [Kiritimatiellia bacterium]|nr:hypothetical protein [Kiritimatiellia bacterium]HRZ13783.1 hypothetical protein [Kiritimatiellia bacterium]HSA19404.1 hypothetical protein [Kiritimatiellia bacterium]
MVKADNERGPAPAREAVSRNVFDGILLDLELPNGNGLNWLPELRDSHPDAAIVIAPPLSEKAISSAGAMWREKREGRLYDAEPLQNACRIETGVSY